MVLNEALTVGQSGDNVTLGGAISSGPTGWVPGLLEGRFIAGTTATGGVMDESFPNSGSGGAKIAAERRPELRVVAEFVAAPAQENPPPPSAGAAAIVPKWSELRRALIHPRKHIHQRLSVFAHRDCILHLAREYNSGNPSD